MKSKQNHSWYEKKLDQRVRTSLQKKEDRFAQEHKAATDRALSWLSENQNKDGGFSTYAEATCESTAQVIVALCELGIDVGDSRFVKQGKSAMDALLTYSVK